MTLLTGRGARLWTHFLDLMDSVDDLSHAVSATRLAEGTVPEGTSTVPPTTGELIGGLPPPVLALCCQFAGDSGSLVKRMACCHRAAAEARSEVWAALFTVGTRVVLHGLKADILNLRRGTIVKSQTAEDRVGVRLDGELKPKSVPRANVRLERGPHETGEPDEVHEGFWCDSCSTMSARDHMLHDALASMRTGRAGAATRSEGSLVGLVYRCTRCVPDPGYDLCEKCFRAGVKHSCREHAFSLNPVPPEHARLNPSLARYPEDDPSVFDPARFKPWRESNGNDFARWMETGSSERRDGITVPASAEEFCWRTEGWNLDGPRTQFVVNSIFKARWPRAGSLEKLRDRRFRECPMVHIDDLRALPKDEHGEVQFEDYERMCENIRRRNEAEGRGPWG